MSTPQNNETIKEYIGKTEAKAYGDHLAESFCAIQACRGKEIRAIVVNITADYFFDIDNYNEALETADKCVRATLIKTLTS